MVHVNYYGVFFETSGNVAFYAHSGSTEECMGEAVMFALVMQLN
jgi:hypothetical protein